MLYTDTTSSRFDRLYRLPNGSRELLVPSRGRVSKVIIRPTKASTFAAHRPYFQRPPPTTKSSSSTTPVAAASAEKVRVNKEFFRQLGAIFRIIVPRWSSKEVALIGAHTTFLLLRTYLSLLVAQLDGKLVGDLVSPPHSLSPLYELNADPRAGLCKRSRIPSRSSLLVPPRHSISLHQFHASFPPIQTRTLLPNPSHSIRQRSLSRQERYFLQSRQPRCEDWSERCRSIRYD